MGITHNLKEVTASIEEVQENLDNYLDRVENDGICVIITRDGKPEAVLVPMDYLELIERMETELGRS